MKNVSKETIARTIILAVALINQILIVMGIIFTTVGVFIVSKPIKKIKKQKRLKAHGTPIKCAVIGLTVDRSIRVNGRYTYRFI